jgi:hypothetical protein
MTLTLTDAEKQEIRDRMTISATYENKEENIDIEYLTLTEFDNLITKFMKKHPTLTKDDIRLNMDKDLYDPIILTYKEKRDIEPLIEQEEKRVLRNKVVEYKNYLKLKTKYEGEK